MSNKQPEAWEQQPKEGLKAYQAFSEYLKLGSTRSIKQVCEKLHKSYTMLSKWSMRHKWRERVAAWNAEEERVFRDVLLEGARRAARNHLALARRVQLHIDERLKSFNPSDLRARDIAMWLDVSVKIERLALGKTSENVGLSDPSGAPLQSLDWSRCSTEQLKAVVEAELIARGNKK